MLDNSDIQIINQLITQKVQKNAGDAQFNVVPIPAHQHTGVDSSQIDSANILNLNPPNISRVFSTTSTGNFATGTTAPSIINILTPNANMIDMFDMTSATGTLTFNNPVGSPKNGQILWVRIASSNAATARSLTFSSSTGGYISGSPAIPGTTTTGQTLMLGFMFDTRGSLNKWRLFSSASA